MRIKLYRITTSLILSFVSNRFLIEIFIKSVYQQCLAFTIEGASVGNIVSYGSYLLFCLKKAGKPQSLHKSGKVL